MPGLSELRVRRVGLDADPGGWGRWEVLDPDGAVVGLVAENRRWLGHRHGPLAFDIACLPQPETGTAACWSATDLATISEALNALARHRHYEHEHQEAPPTD